MVTQTDGASGSQWTTNTAVSTTANTKGVVTMTKVTASVIEGTYTLTDAPVSTVTATAASTPAAVSLTNGTFRVIYPR